MADDPQNAPSMRRRLRLHLSTWVILVLVAVFLFLIIVPGENLDPLSFRARGAAGTVACEFEHGWPWVFLRRRVTLPFTPSVRPPADVLPWMHPWAWSMEGETSLPPVDDRRPITRTVLGFWPAAAALDVVAAVAILTLLGWLLERRHRRRKLWQFSLAELFVATLVFSYGLVYWLNHSRAAAIEERAIVAKAQLSKYLGPLWLRRVVGVDRLESFKHIISLNLVSLPDEPLDGLANQFPYLQTLSVALLRGGEDDLREIGQLSELRTLTIRAGGLVTDDGLMQLANLKKLHHFEATGLPSVTSDGIRFVAGLRHLKALLLTDVPIGARGMAVVCECRQLEKLLLNQKTFGKTGEAGALAGSDALRGLSRLTNLRELVLVDGVRDDDLVYLAPLTKLERLGLFENYVTDEGIQHLTGRKRLKRLEMRRTNVSLAGIAELRRALPECVVDVIPNPLPR
jgi:hypothetical protein